MKVKELDNKEEKASIENLEKAKNKEDKKIKEIKFSIFNTSKDLFNFYIYNNYKKFSTKIYSIYSKISPKSKNLDINDSSITTVNINNINDTQKIKLPNQILMPDKNINNNNIIKNKAKTELLLYNNDQLKKNIYIFLENELKINNIKVELRDCQNQILQIKKYNEFKNKIIIYFFSSIIILKYYNIISITSLSIISLMKKIKIANVKSYIVVNNKQINFILDNLWNISNQTTKNIFLNLSEIIYNNVDKLPLNEKYSQDKFITLIENIYNDIRDKCNYFIHIIKVLKENINNLENAFYDRNSIINNNIYEYKMRFLYILHDIICSDMFYSTFVESYEEEIKAQIEEVKKFFEKQKEKTLLAIVYDLDSYKGKQLINYENINKIEIDKKENEKIDEIFMNYQSCLLSIDL